MQDIKAIRDGEFVDATPDTVDYVLDNTHSLATTGINLVPLANNVATPRQFYANRFWSQTDPLEDPDEAWVQSLYENDKSFEREYGKYAGAVFADNDGEVIESTDDYVKVRYDNGEERQFDLYRNLSLNRKNFFNQTPVVQAGQRFKAGDAVAKSNFTTDKGTIAMGRNARVALVPYKGYTLDDATVVSESMANRLKSEHMLDYIRDAPEAGTRIDVPSFQSTFSQEYTQEQLAKLDRDTGAVKPGTIVHKGDPLLLSTSSRRVSMADRNRGALSKYLRNTRVNNSQVWEYDEPGIVEDVVTNRRGETHVLVKTTRPAKTGDKLVTRTGNKYTISKIIPDHLMPQDESGEAFDMLANPLGINSRANVAFPFEMLLSKVAKHDGKPVVMPSFNHPDERRIDQVRQMLAERGLSETERIYDPESQRFLESPVTTGGLHLLKLQHQSEGKRSERGIGGYTSWEQPLKGGSEAGQAKRLSGLETTALLSAGAYGYLKDGATVRGQRNADYWAAVREGRQPPKVGHPFAFNRTEALLHGAGYRVRDLGGGIRRIGPTSDRDLEEFKAEELDNAELIDPNTGEAIPGGLFDNSRTERKAWGKITLDIPVPNPAFEPHLIKLLGLTRKDYESVFAGKQSLKPSDSNPEKYTGPLGMYRFLKEMDPKQMEEQMRDEVRSGNKTKRPRAIDVLNTLKGLERNELAPHDLMITAVPVIPAHYRPFSYQGDTFIAGDVNQLYRDVFRLRDQNKQMRALFGAEGANEHNLTLLRGIRALYGHGKTENRKLREQGVEGYLKSVLGESPKYSVFQRNLFSKTVDFTGRGVIEPDPTLGVDETGLPEEQGWKLFAPYVEQRLVRSGMTPAEAIKAVRDRDPKARIMLEQEAAERPIVIGRAPSWHKLNTIGSYAKFHDGNALMISPLIAPGLNADYDGDQQIHHVYLLTPINTTNIKNENNRDLDLTKLHIPVSFEVMNTLPTFNKETHTLSVVDLQDFPRTRLLGTKNGKNGRIDFYEVPEGTKVIALDEKTNKPIWADVSMFSFHPGREVELVQLNTGATIITDNDPRAVYGVAQDSTKLVRATPTDAKASNMMVPYAHSLNNPINEIAKDYIPLEGWPTGRFPLNWETGYLLGAMVGDGWYNKKEYETRSHDFNWQFHIADLGGHVAKTLQSIFDNLLGVGAITYHSRSFTKEQYPDRYGDTVRHTFSSNAYGKTMCALFKAAIGGEREENHTGSGSKHLPTFAFTAPRAFREGLLCGVMDTDGSVSVSNSKSKPQLLINMGSTSLKLLRDVRLLLKSLAVSSTITFGKYTVKGNKAWTLSMSSTDMKQQNILSRLQTPYKRDTFLNTSVNLTAASAASQDLVPFPKEVIEFVSGSIPTTKNPVDDSEEALTEWKLKRSFASMYSKSRKTNYISRISAQQLLGAVRAESLRKFSERHKANELLKSLVKHDFSPTDSVDLFKRTVDDTIPYDTTDKTLKKLRANLKGQLNTAAREGKLRKVTVTGLLNLFTDMEVYDPSKTNKEFLAWESWVLNKEVRWAYIKEVEYTKEIEDGYDLTVPGYETFMNVDGVILSNTMSVNVPSLPEAVEDVKNKLMASKQVFSIRNIEDIPNVPQQDLLLGLYRAKNSPAKNSHVFATRADALAAIKAGRVSFSDELTIQDEQTV